MNSQSAIRDARSAIRIVVAGGGPAGSSLAIRLAKSGFEVTLFERKRFPRQKLCGEFISPECLAQFETLGVLDELLSAGGDRIVETRFYETGGHSVGVPSSWFSGRGFALSLSRAEMDSILLEHARRSGVEVHEGISITEVVRDNRRIAGLKGRDDARRPFEIAGNVFVDATGRAQAITKLVARTYGEQRMPIKPAFVGFKAHLREASIPRGVCEIYSFPGGYAGLSNVEDEMANLCFLVRAEAVRSSVGNASDIVEQFVFRNKRAAETLSCCEFPDDWLAVSIDGFGTRSLAPADNLFTVGDAASFIDPFTGSGMSMAFESSEVLAEVISAGGTAGDIAREYSAAYRLKFARRLRVCSVLRRTAFMPRLATGVVGVLGLSRRARKLLARATRG